MAAVIPENAVTANNRREADNLAAADHRVVVTNREARDVTTIGADRLAADKTSTSISFHKIGTRNSMTEHKAFRRWL